MEEGPASRRPWTTAMEEGDEGRHRFGFRVKAEATVTIEGSNARDARDLLGGLLDGTTAKVVAGAAMGIEFVDIYVSPDVALVLIDGADPMEPLRIALSNWLLRGDVDGR